MANFCPNCGTKLATPDVKFCPECGERIAPTPPSPMGQIDKLKPSQKTTHVKKPVSDTSRLVGLTIEKYLMPNELPIYATRGRLFVGGEADLRGYVTNHRVIFYASKGLVFKSDRLHEIPLSELRSYKIVEEGLVFKSMYLKLNDLTIKGDRSDILELYKSIQSAKYQK